MMQLRTAGVELLSCQHEGFRLLVLRQLTKQGADGFVSRRRGQVELDAVRRKLLEEELQAAVLDAPSECPAAHDPGIDVQRISTAPARQYGDAAQWTETVAISHRDDESSLSLRGFDVSGALAEARLVAPGEADAAIRVLLADPRIAHINAHNAAAGCFAARIERDGDAA